jgi:phospho-N-acetylmuramoyl-pentapeptide-transferase
MFATFIVAMAWAPTFIRVLRKLKIEKQIRDVETAPIMAALHAGKAGTPTMGGILIWFTVLVVTLLVSLNSEWNYLSRAQTLLPLGAFIAAACIGLVDDYLNMKRIGPNGGGLRVRHKFISYALIAIFGAWWFYSKLQWDIVHIPFVGNFEMGWTYILFFTSVIIATSHSVNMTDGLDGLVGGPLIASFSAYAVIAFVQGNFDLAILCAAIIGGLMAFLWYNVMPASFFMGDTGAMSLGTLLGIVALLTNQPLLLLIIGFPFVIESLSVILQVLSKKIFHRKIFMSSPIHHHLEAIGWTESQIVFRMWILSLFSAGIGVAIALKDHI